MENRRRRRHRLETFLKLLFLGGLDGGFLPSNKFTIMDFSTRCSGLSQDYTSLQMLKAREAWVPFVEDTVAIPVPQILWLVPITVVMDCGHCSATDHEGLVELTVAMPQIMEVTVKVKVWMMTTTPSSLILGCPPSRLDREVAGRLGVIPGVQSPSKLVAH